MRQLAVSSLGLLFLVVPITAEAVEFRGGAERVVVAESEVIEGDLYASGGSVVVDGVVLGDVVAAGREVFLNGRVEGDFLAAAQTVVIRGFVGDDARIAGSVLHLGSDGTIGDHLVAAGYSFEAEPGSLVGGDAFFAGAKVLAAGTFESGLRLTGSAVEISGSVVGDAEVELSGGSLEGSSSFEGFFSGPVPPPQVSDGLTVADSSQIGGSLSYRSPAELEVPEVAQGGVEWERSPVTADADAGEATTGERLVARIVDQVRRFVVLLLLGLLLLWLTPSWVSQRAEQVRAEPLKCLAWGAAGLVAAPLTALAVLVLAIALAVLFGKLTLGGLATIGILVGLALVVVLVVGFVVVVGYLSQVLVSLAAGRALLHRGRPEAPPAAGHP